MASKNENKKRVKDKFKDKFLCGKLNSYLKYRFDETKMKIIAVAEEIFLKNPLKEKSHLGVST